ncbi:hypothetical protein TYRP_022419 [Tyrophagus putrescentiae]|nr:hypothetical protein TYRP_022419 [Tyrophagus putrescentiae]
MTKHYDELSGRIAKLVVDKEDMEKVIQEGGSIPEAYEALVFTDYEKANTLWRHTGTLKAKWIEVVGAKGKFPPIPNGTVLLEQLNEVEAFLLERINEHRRTSLGAQGPLASTGIGTASHVRSGSSLSTVSGHDVSIPGVDLVGNDIEDVNIDPNSKPGPNYDLDLSAYFAERGTIFDQPSTSKGPSPRSASKTVTIDPPNKSGGGSGGGNSDANNPPADQDGSSGTGGNAGSGNGSGGTGGAGGSSGAGGSGGDGGDGRGPNKPTGPNDTTKGDAEDDDEVDEEDEDRLFLETLFSIGAHSRPNDDGDDDPSDSSSDDEGFFNRRTLKRLNRQLNDALQTFRQNYRPARVNHNANTSGLTPFNRHLVRDLPVFSGEYLDFPEFFELFLRSVDRTDLPTSYKLIYLKKHVDKETLKLIKTYTARDYNKAIQRIIEKFTGLTSVMQHIRECLYKLPRIKHPYDLESLTELTEQLRSIQTLFGLYKLDKGFEMEVFRHFYDRYPNWMTDKFMSRLGHKLPELKPFLKVLDAHVKDLRVRSLYKLSKGNQSARGHNKSYNTFYDKYDKGRFRRRNYANQGTANEAQLVQAPTTNTSNNPQRQQGNRGNQGYRANQPNSHGIRNQGRRNNNNQYRANNFPRRNNNNQRAANTEQVANVNVYDDDSSDSTVGLRGLYSRCGQIYALENEEECKCVDIDFEINGSRLTVKFLLYDDRSTVILGMGVKRAFKIAIDYDSTVLQFDEPRQTYTQLSTYFNGSLMGVEMDYDLPMEVGLIIQENASVFVENSGKIGKINSEECHLHLTSEIPITLRPYRCTQADQANIDAQVGELLKKELIRESNSPYSFPVLMVDKKDEGQKTRLCINYIKLNEVTESEHFPMPKIDDMKDLFLNAVWFTTIDIASGFHHVAMHEADKRKTAFSTMNGHYEWNRMPFGLKNAPIVFQRIISNLLRKHKFQSFATNYIDDIIVFSKTFEEHLSHLQQLLRMVAEENISLKLSKCQFAKTSVVYLGFLISKNTVEPMKSNTEAIEKASPPTDLKSLRGFLGKVNYYQKFIPNRAVLLHPLYQLLKKNKTWKWEEEEQEAFQKVKGILTSYPVLRIFDPSFKTFLYTDASRQGLGAVLKQSDPSDSSGTQHAVGYFSKSLNPHQLNYSTTELELLAIISAIDYWHYYLIGRHFLIFTDHLPLKSVNKIGKPNTRLFNWAIRLRQYDFKVEYRPGDKNQEADFLSRHPIKQLQDLTSGMVFWLDEEKVEQAQRNCSATDLPKNVFVTEFNGQRRLVYRHEDLVKDYLPDDYCREILTELHLIKGHLGYKSLELHFSRRYYNPRLQSIINSIIKACPTCAQVKAQTRKYGTMGVIGPACEPFEIIHIDTKSGFKANHQSANGLVERVNRTIVDRLRCKHLESPKRCWTTLLNEVVDEYNHSIHSSTLFTPSFLLTGVDKENLFTEEPLHVARLKALEHSNQVHEENTQRFSDRLDPDLDVGEPVYVQAKHALNRGMLDPRFEGPYLIEGKLGHTTYEVNRGEVINLIRESCVTVSEVKALGMNSKHVNRLNRHALIGKRELLEREKRFAILAAAIGGLVSYGIISIEHYFENKGVTANEEAMDKQLSADIDLLRQNNQKVQHYQKLLLDALDQTIMQQQRMQSAYQGEAESARILNAILFSISEMKIHLEGNPFLSLSPVTYWTSHQCEFMEPNVLVMKFDIPRIEKTIKILEAVPFFIMGLNDEGLECMKTYNGIKYVIWDTRTDCTRDLFRTSVHSFGGSLILSLILHLAFFLIIICFVYQMAKMEEEIRAIRLVQGAYVPRRPDYLPLNSRGRVERQKRSKEEEDLFQVNQIPRQADLPRQKPQNRWTQYHPDLGPRMAG